MFTFIKRKYLYYLFAMAMIILAIGIVIGGLNLAAQRMAQIIPGLPTQIVSSQMISQDIQIKFLDYQIKIPLPTFLKDLFS